jgi:hypothetical protein
MKVQLPYHYMQVVTSALPADCIDMPQEPGTMSEDGSSPAFH